MSTTLFYLCAPSGAGKNALLSALNEFESAPYVAIRTITRPADVTEASEPVTESEFSQLKEAGLFALDWSANGFHYGIRTSEIACSDSVIINGSRAYWPEAKRRFPDMALVTIEVPEPILKDRLLARGRESEFEIFARLKRNRELSKELQKETPFCTLINDRSPRDMAVDFMERLGCISG
jgi:ribose 1,5-bisphosphokinase